MSDNYFKHLQTKADSDNLHSALGGGGLQIDRILDVLSRQSRALC